MKRAYLRNPVRGLLLAVVFGLIPAGAEETQDVPAGPAGPPITLKARLNAGKTYTVRQVMKSETELPLGDGGKAETTLEYGMTMAVGAAEPDGSKTVGVSMDGFKMKMEMGEVAMEYDSADPDKQNPLLKGMMGQMAGKKFEARFDKDDRMLDVGKGKEGKKSAAAPNLMGMTLGEDEVRQIMASLVDHGFPEGEVKPGDRWKHRVDSAMGQMGSFAMEMEYEYLGEADHEGHACAKLRVRGGKAAAPAVAEGKGKPAAMEIAKADMEGEILFDNKEGIARHTEMSMDMVMSAGDAELSMASKVTSSLVDIGKTE